GAFKRSDALGAAGNKGGPPDVDVYIDDGRHGDYQYVRNYSTTDIWSRKTLYSTPPTRRGANQDLKANRDNYIYVLIKNRGAKGDTAVTSAGHYRVATPAAA